MHAPKQSQVCVQSIPFTRGKGQIQSEESHMELTHVWSCPAMPGNPGVWGEDGSWASEESATQINGRKGADSQVNRLPATHAQSPRAHTQPHTQIFPCNSPDPWPRLREVKHSTPSHQLGFSAFGGGELKGACLRYQDPPRPHTHETPLR